ncbi:MAG: HAMP domain-containing sensor histidine kinase [Alphaproteobacteria bacterium]
MTHSLVGRLALAGAGLFAIACVAVWFAASAALDRFAAGLVDQRMVEIGEDLRGAWATAEITGAAPVGPADLAWLWQIAVDGETRYRAVVLDRADLDLPTPPASETFRFAAVDSELGPLWLASRGMREIAPAAPDVPIAARAERRVNYAVAVLESQRQAWIAEQAAPLRRVALWIMAALAGSLLAGLGLLSLALRRPLNRLRLAADRHRRGEAERLEGRFPSELAGVVASLNQALAHNARLIERTRRYVAKIAHDLKHPISVARNALDTPAEHDLARRRLDGMTALIDRYTALARAIGPGTPGPPVDVAALLEEARAGFALLYRNPPLVIDVDCPAGLTATVAAADLDTIVANLIGNAHKHAASRIRVTARLGLIIEVEDDGPGLAPDEREKALAWGERLDDAPPGSGFGLAIVQDIVALYGGRLELSESALGGLKATVSLPA